jgi:hypothetical protein
MPPPRGVGLLILPGVGVGPLDGAEVGDFVFRETLRPGQFAVAGVGLERHIARIGPADIGCDRLAVIIGLAAQSYSIGIMRWQYGRPEGENGPGDVVLMRALHDHHDDTGLHVVEAVRHRLPEPAHRLGSHRLGFGLLDVVGVVENDPIATLTGADAADR